MAYKTKAISYDSRVRIFWTLAAACMLFLVVYVYAINMTIRNTAERAELEALVADLGVETSSLEFEYIAKKSEVDMELAYSYGFREAEKPLYVSRARAGGLTLNTAR